MSLLSELEADLKELQHFLSIAQRKRTQELLKADIESIKLDIEKVIRTFVCHRFLMIYLGKSPYSSACEPSG